MTRAFQDHSIRQYLLGDLLAPDEGELETAYVGDPALLARVELARDDLADDYAAARRSAADRETFERRILGTPNTTPGLRTPHALRTSHVARCTAGSSPPLRNAHPVRLPLHAERHDALQQVRV